MARRAPLSEPVLAGPALVGAAAWPERRPPYLPAESLPARIASVPWRPRRTEPPPVPNPAARSFNIRQLTDVLGCNLQHHF
jgi:hypothetical protein